MEGQPFWVNHVSDGGFEVKTHPKTEDDDPSGIIVCVVNTGSRRFDEVYAYRIAAALCATSGFSTQALSEGSLNSMVEAMCICKGQLEYEMDNRESPNDGATKSALDHTKGVLKTLGIKF